MSKNTTGFLWADETHKLTLEERVRLALAAARERWPARAIAEVQVQPTHLPAGAITVDCVQVVGGGYLSANQVYVVYADGGGPPPQMRLL